jgi:hypothetical protein
MKRFLGALALTVFAVPGSGVSAQTTPAPMVMTMAPMPPASMTLALDARSLRGARTRSGYGLSGQALVKDACTAARFSPSGLTIFPPQYNIVQYRQPSAMGMMCMPRAVWVTIAPLTVTSAYPPSYVTARTRKGITRVPIR